MENKTFPSCLYTSFAKGDRICAVVEKKWLWREKITLKILRKVVQKKCTGRYKTPLFAIWKKVPDNQFRPRETWR